MTYSQYSQDTVIKRLHPKTGNYIDIGAFDGVNYSNTYLLEQSGWEGICFEPAPDAYLALIRNRKSINYNAAVLAYYGSSAFNLVAFNGMLGHVDNGPHAAWVDGLQSEAHERIRVKVYDLNTIISLHELKQVNYISIDSEGSELEVLAGFNFKVPVRIWSIENSYHGNAIRKIMRRHGYYLLTMCGVDEIYVRGLPLSGWVAWYFAEGLVKKAVRFATKVKKSIFPKAWIT